MTDKLEHEGTEVKDLQCFQTVSYRFLDFHFNPIGEMYL